MENLHSRLYSAPAALETDEINIEKLTFDEFSAMSVEEQREYIDSIRNEFRATNQMIADMMGTTKSIIYKLTKRIGCTERPGSVKLTMKEKQRFYDWLDSDDMKPAKTNETQNEDFLNSKIVEKTQKVTVSGTIPDMITILQLIQGSADTVDLVLHVKEDVLWKNLFLTEVK